jgi:hypothetical protein
MNVDIDKARHDGSSVRLDFSNASRQIDFPSRSDGGNLAPLNDYDGIGNFFKGSECSIGADDNRLHSGGNILLETHRNRESPYLGEDYRGALRSGMQGLGEVFPQAKLLLMRKI